MYQDQLIRDCKIGQGTRIWRFVNLFECEIGENCTIGTFVEIGKGVKVGNDCKIETGVFIPGGVEIEANCFIGPNVVFTNDKYPKIGRGWEIRKTLVKKGASIGANSTIVCGITIGENSLIGAGSVVTKDVPANSVVVGNPAKIIRKLG